MSTPQIEASAGYSPDISIILHVQGKQFSIASLGPSEIIVRNPQRLTSSDATIRLTVDKQVSTFHIRLPEGINPDQVEQSYQLLETIEEAAA